MSLQRERLLATAQELAHVGSWELDLATERTLWSPGMYRIVGLEPGDRARTHDEILEFVHPDDRERIGSLFLSVIEEPDDFPEEGVSGEFRLVRADGTIREARGRGTLVRDAAGLPVRWIGVIQDVTEHRLTERELQAHYAVTEALREWQSFEQGVMELLRLLGTALLYQMGSLWLWEDEPGALTCRAFWHAPDVDPENFEAAKRGLKFRSGEGKPGRAWQTREPVITPDAATDPLFRPRDAAMVRGIRSGLAFPAVGSDAPVAVLSFYSLEHRLPSSSLVRTLSAIGHELGRFLEKRRYELDPRPLSNREVEVLRLAAEGNAGPDIADKLFLSPATVKTHFENMYEKLGVSDRPAAVAQGLRLGLIR